MMRALTVWSVVAVTCLLSTGFVVAADSSDSTIVTTITTDTIELTVPASALILRLPKRDLAPVEEPRTGAQTNQGYFHFSDVDRGLVVSGWFEPAASFEGFEKFWLGEFSAMKQTGLIPKAPPTSVAVGNWLGAAYDIEVPSTLDGVVNTHVRAHLIKAGTWIDIHISVTAEMPIADARREALEFLKSIVVIEKD